jgi:PTS hybrid protein
VADAPLVEGAVAAAVAAAGGADLAAVAAVATTARPDAEPAAAPDAVAVSVPEAAPVAESVGPVPGADVETVAGQHVAGQQVAGPSVEADVVLANEVGLHARPAAVLARAVSGLDAEVTVRLGDQQADARSVLALLGLAARKGDRLTVVARGNQAAQAIQTIRQLIADNFGE